MEQHGRCGRVRRDFRRECLHGDSRAGHLGRRHHLSKPELYDRRRQQHAHDERCHELCHARLFHRAPNVAATVSANIIKLPATSSTYVNGGGTLTLSGTDTLGSPLFVDNATLQIGSGCVAIATSFQLASKANATLNITGGSMDIGPGISNTLYVCYTGSGAATASTINISAGTLTTAARDNFSAFNGSSTTINLSGAGVFNMSAVANYGATTGGVAVLNINGGTATFASNLGLGGSGSTANAGAGVINQTAGLVTTPAAAQLFVGFDNFSAGYAYGGYLLSGGTLNYGSGTLFIAHEASVMGLFSQSGGSATITGPISMADDPQPSTTGNLPARAVIDISGGTMTHKGAGIVMNTGSANASSTSLATGIMTVRNNGYFQDQSNNILIVANKAGATGILNVVSGGTLEAGHITATGSSGTSTINFDGGTLRAYNATNAASFLTGLNNAFVYPGGLTFDTNSQNITIPQTLSAPQGYEVGTTGSTIAVTGGSGGSGYIGPPVVTFSSTGSEVQATGVAVLGTGGSVAGIIITSPGSGYANGQPVTVTFNGNSNTSNAATSMAGSFSVNANTLLGSGGLTVVGGGTLTLAASNGFTGNTNVKSGALYLNGVDNSLSISVSGGATLGGSGATTANVNVAPTGILDFSRNSGAFTAGNLAFLGGATINFGALSSHYDNNIPALSVGALTPSATAGLIGISSNPLGATLVSGTYDLINYTGSIGGAGSSAFTLFSVPGLSSSQNAFLVNQNNQIDIVVTGPQPYWNGTGPDWKSTNAFTIVPGGTPETFQTGDADVFDDTAGLGAFGGTVLLSTSNVAPASVTFNNNSLAYTLSGNFGITGNTPLNLIGSGSVTIANSNSYTGTTTIGPFATLQIGNGGASGSLSPSSAIAVNGTLAFSRSDNIVQGTQFSSAAITGVGGLTQLGPGMVSLTAGNTYSGPTTITAGTLQLGTGAAGQDGSISGAGGVNDNATLAYNLAGSQTVSYPIGGSGGLEKAGTGTLILANSNAYSGGTTVNAGTLQLNTAAIGITGGGVGTLQPGGLVTVNSGATLRVNATDALGYYVGSTGTIGLVGGAMTITAGIHTNVGYLGLTAGTISSLGAGDSSGNFIFNGGVTTFASTAPSVINATTVSLRDSVDSSSSGLTQFNVARGSGPVDLIISSNLTGVAGGAGVQMVGPGIMWLTGNGSYLGSTEIDSGTLQVGAGGAAGALPTGSQIVDEGTLAFSRSDNIAQGTQFSGTISGVGGITQLGPGKLTLNAANTYSGTTAISGGVLNAASIGNQFSPSAIGEGAGSPGDLVIDSGTLQYTGAAAQNSNRFFTVGPTGAATVDASGGPVGTLTLGTGGGAIAFANGAAPATLTLTGSGAGVLNAVVGDSGTSPNVTSLVKTGTGTWTLAGANTYSGTTTVSSGRLNIAGVNAGAGPLNVNAGALYITGSAAATSISVAGAATLGGTGAAASATANVANSGILDLSQNAGAAFSLGGLNFAGQATINVDALANYASSPVLSTGALAISSTAGLVTINANLGSATVLAGTYDIINYNGSIGGAGSAGFTLSPITALSNRQSAALLNQSHQIDVVVTGGNPFWNGNQPDWLSTGAFTLQGGGGTTTFQTGDTDIFDDSANGSTFGGNVGLNIGNLAPSVVQFNNTNLAYTLSGAFGITGSGSLSVAGSGLVTIANSNSYTGATTIGSFGTLQIGAGGASGALSPSSSITVNGTLAFSRSDNIVQGTQFSSAGISGNGGLVQLGPGIVTLTATNTYSGPTTISAGTLQLGTGAAGQDGSISGIGGVNDNGTLAYNLAGTQTAGYSIGGGGNLSTIGSGTLVLAGSNGYFGATTVTGGVLQVGNSAAFGATSGLAISAGTVNLAGNNPVVGALSGAIGAVITNSGPAAATLTTNPSGVSTFAGTIADGSAQTSLTLGGAGNLILAGNNTYSGTTAVTGGTLTVPAGGSINSNANIFVGGPGGATLNVVGGVVTTNYNVGFNSVFALTIGYNGQPGTVNVSSGTLNLAGATTGIVMGGNNTGAPATFIQTGGVVNVGTETTYMANEPGGVSQMFLSGGTFNNASGSVVIGERDNATLTVSGNAVVNLNNGVDIDNSAGNAYTLNCTLNVQGGTVTQVGGNFIAGNGLGTGTYNQTGGAYICESANVLIGNGIAGGTGIMSVSAGTFVETGGTMVVGQNSTSSGSLSVGGGASLAGVYAPGIFLAGGSTGATGTVSLLTNGALLVGALGISQGSGAGTFNLDGGTLAANGSTVNFMQGLTAAIVEESGGVIDNRGFAITIAQNLQSGGINPVDGGLLFQGAGTTTLSGTNTYNGGTTVIGGTLIAADSQAIEDGTNLSVGNGLLAFGAIVPSQAANAAAAPSVSPVPEPGALALAVALLGGAGLYHRQRRAREAKA